jgi:EAL domain-containing protein (putative c-di-GMP-specific phosphodiesterase class I)
VTPETELASMNPSAQSSNPAALRAVVRQEEFRAALRDDQVVLHYQPILNLGTGNVRGVEALLRWEHPQGGLLYPDDFLPAIAHTPAMPETTRWVLDRACRDQRRWPDLTVSVNVAARDVTDPHFVDAVRAAMAEHDVDPHHLILELTEHAVVADLDLATQVLGQLRELGVGLSLDDFGTGYSSLLYLRELPLTEVKIDREFVSDLVSRSDNAAIVDSVVRLAEAVGLEVVAEGVESEEQAAHLHELGCDSAQGYLWGHPEAADDLELTGLDGWVPAAGDAERSRRKPRPPLPSNLVRRMRELIEVGASLHTIAAALNSEGLRTPKQTRWTATTVAKAIASLPPV